MESEPIDQRSPNEVSFDVLQGRFTGGAYSFDVFESGFVVARGHGVNRVGIGEYASMLFPNGDGFTLGNDCKSCNCASPADLLTCIKKASKEARIERPYRAYHLQGHWIDYIPDDPGKGHASSGIFRIRWAVDERTGKEIDTRATFLVNGGLQFNIGEGGMIENEQLNRCFDPATGFPQDPVPIQMGWPIVVNNGWIGIVNAVEKVKGNEIVLPGDELVFSGPGYGYLARKTDRQVMFNGVAIPNMKVSNSPLAGDMICATVVDLVEHRSGSLKLEFDGPNNGRGVLVVSNPTVGGGFDCVRFTFIHK